MQPYRFDRLVQRRLLQLQLALFILVKVISTLSDICKKLIIDLYKENVTLFFTIKQIVNAILNILAMQKSVAVFFLTWYFYFLLNVF